MKRMLAFLDWCCLILAATVAMLLWFGGNLLLKLLGKEEDEG